MRVQILGSTRLARVAGAYVTERKGARLVGIDPGEEHEADPWFAPVRGFARDNGAVVGRAPADLTLDLDPSARPTRGEAPMLRVLAPAGARSPDINRALLAPGDWALVLAPADGTGAWATRALGDVNGLDADDALELAVTRAVEALDHGWDAMIAAAPATPLPRSLIAGRFRAQECFVNWHEPADRVASRIRACAGPWGGARAYVGEATVHLLDADVAAADTPAGFDPGVIVAATDTLDVATGRGVVRVRRLRPGWRPARPAARYAEELGIATGYQLT